jgi:hypothetical protein
MITNQDAVNERANDLEAANFNGLKRLIVRVFPAAAPPHAELEVHLHNPLHRNTLILAGDTPARASLLFPLRGGRRIRAGSATGQVRVLAVNAGPSADSIILRTAPIGDYSTYILSVDPDGIDPALGLAPVLIDPLFTELPFKFRPGCFTNNCAPEWNAPPSPKPSPNIDYLAKDFDSFRHTMMAAMMQRVPGWQPTSEADLDQLLISLTSAVADELSDYQDRVLNEAYFVTCRSRVSLARHARLMDYHIHQGNQASSWIALELDRAVVAGTVVLPRRHRFWTGEQVAPGFEHRVAGAQVFATRAAHQLHPILNRLMLYTWDDAISGLAAGSTSADLAVDPAGLGLTEQQGAQLVADFVNQTNPAQPRLRQLLIQETLNPLTGRSTGRDPARRQLLRLLENGAGAVVVQDTLRNRFLVRLAWREEDQLRWDYRFVVFPGGLRIGDVSLFHGNLVRAHHGEFQAAIFRERGEPLAPDDLSDPTQPVERHFERTVDQRYGVLCRLPHAPLCHLPTPAGGEVPPRSTLRVAVEIPGAGSDLWDEVINLVHSDDSEENGDHFAVETDERQLSVLRFGNGANGRLLPSGSTITCEYQVGQGGLGNVGTDTLVNTGTFGGFVPVPPPVSHCWNPFDVTDGADPEPVAKILRNAPEAYRARQLRAVTTADYIKRAREVPGVSQAAATYLWTGSWRTVRVAIDPAGAAELSSALAAAVGQHLEAVRLIGEDLEIRPPRYVPLYIFMVICIHPDFWPRDVRHVLEQEFSDGFTPDGRLGFFHPDNWTFGKRIRKSELAGRVHQVAGTEHINTISWGRFNEPTPGMYADVESGPDQLFIGPDEIVQVHNDPDHLERGFIRFYLQGGRQ